MKANEASQTDIVYYIVFYTQQIVLSFLGL